MNLKVNHHAFCDKLDLSTLITKILHAASLGPNIIIVDQVVVDFGTSIFDGPNRLFEY